MAGEWPGSRILPVRKVLEKTVIRRTPLKRSGPPRRNRDKSPIEVTVGKLGRIRLKGDALAALRRRVFLRDKWACQNCGAICGWASGHLAHYKSRGAGGSDTEENTRLLCADCHQKSHNCGGKPLPSKHQP